jgi:type IV pilus biogenesis protein PilP
MSGRHTLWSNAGVRAAALSAVLATGMIAGLATGLATPSAHAQARSTAQQTPQPVEVTIDTLVRLRQAELQEEFNQRVRRLMPAPPAPVAAAAPARASSSPDFYRPAPPPPKRVAAIYGRKGAEVADIELPGGQMITVSAGAQIESYRVSGITSAGVELVGFAPTRSASAETSRVRGQAASKMSVRSGAKDTQASHAVPSSEPAEAMEVRKRIPLGGTFD